MIDPTLKARATAALQNPPRQTPERDALVYAYMTAESLKLERIETSTEEILELVRFSETAHSDTLSAEKTKESLL